MRGPVIALVALAAVLVAIPLSLAYLADRNGHASCDATVPPGMAASSDRVVQNKHRVTLFPLTLECSYTTEQNPALSDYAVISHDIGTAWWVGAPIALLAAAVVGVTGRRRR